MKKLYASILLVIPVLAVSCSRKVESTFDSIRYVDKLLTDSLPSLRAKAAAAGGQSGVIALFGEPGHCLRLSEKMMLCDEFDNVNAGRTKDGLPDFSGETIVSILDFAGSPYEEKLQEDDGKTQLRENTVRNALNAIDTTINCKILVICSPLLAEFGGDDVSNLFERIGCDVPVIYSKDTSFSFTEACFMVMREKNLFTHNIAYPAAGLMMTVSDRNGSPSGTIGFDDFLVPPSFADTVGVLAPNTYISYVQNQHQTRRN